MIPEQATAREIELSQACRSSPAQPRHRLGLASQRSTAAPSRRQTLGTLGPLAQETTPRTSHYLALHLTLYCTSRPLSHRHQSPLPDCVLWPPSALTLWCGGSLRLGPVWQLWPVRSAFHPTSFIGFPVSNSARSAARRPSPVACRLSPVSGFEKYLYLPLALQTRPLARPTPRPHRAYHLSRLPLPEGPSRAGRPRASGPLSASRPDASHTGTPHR